jgi:hypothetical protein
MRKYLTVLVLALLAAPLFADIELSTSINDVFHRGSNELAGSITMNVNEDDFNDASTEEPIFVRVTLDHQARLARTLVNLASTDGAINDPIYLAMQINQSNGAIGCSADRETTSIVRWVAGESAFWIRVQTPTSTWIDLVATPGDPVPPREGLTVSWTVGVSARKSRDDNDFRSNLPFNTREPATAGDDEDASSTLICVNLSGSTLTTDGVESLLNYDPIAFNYRAEIGLGQYSGQSGDDTGINFTNDFAIARGKDRSCETLVVGKPAAPPTSLCVSQAGTNQNIDGFIVACNTIEFSIDCESGGLYLDTDLLAGAYVTLSTGGRGTYGFPATGGAYFYAVESNDVVLGGVYEEDTDTEFTSHSEDFYRSVDLVWNSTTKSLDGYRFGVEACVWYFYSDGPVKVDLDWSITLVNHEGEFDTDDTLTNTTSGGDFDGADQHRRCPPSEYQVGSGIWDFGEFVECTGNPVAIFFPYIPKLQGGDFWAGLSVVNQGGVDFADGGIEAIAYHEDGTEFKAALPALNQRNQFTWLMVNEAQGPGFYGMGVHENEFVAPQPVDPAVDPASFGETRLSMFIVGSFVAEYLEQRFVGDLDGYMLVGAGTDIDGSYLPRNYDNDITGQDADLPLNRSKRAGNKTAVISNEVGKVSPAKFHFRNGRYQDQ